MDNGNVKVEEVRCGEIVANAELPLVTVVIPTYNRPDAAILCAQSVLKSVLDKPVEVIIVDDCSTKADVPQVVKVAFPNEPRVLVLRLKCNSKPATARNIGGKYARGKYVFFLDDDNELKSNTIADLVAALETGNYGVAAPLAVNIFPNGVKRVWARTFTFNPWTSMPHNCDSNVDYTPEYAQAWSGKVVETWYTANGYMMSRSLFEQLGGYFPWYEMYMEESDLCMRARELGHKVGVVMDAVTWHSHYNDSGDMVMRQFAANAPWKAYRLARNRLYFAWRHYSFLQVLSIMFIFAPLLTGWYFTLSVIRGWPKIGFAFLWGHCVGVVTVLALWIVQLLHIPWKLAKRPQLT